MPIKNRNYDIDDRKYKELYYFCLQYWDKKREIDRIMLSGGGNGLFTHLDSGGNYSDSTANKALKIEKISHDCDLIEQAAISAAGGNDYPALLKNVTNGETYEQLRADGHIFYCGRNYFYKVVRKKFYWILSQKK